MKRYKIIMMTIGLVRGIIFQSSISGPCAFLDFSMIEPSICRLLFFRQILYYCSVDAVDSMDSGDSAIHRRDRMWSQLPAEKEINGMAWEKNRSFGRSFDSFMKTLD